MEIVEVNSHHPERHLLVRAAEVISKGGIIAYPTETVYGLGADAFNSVAIRRIYELKGRTPEKALSLIVGNTEQVISLAQYIGPGAEQLMNVFWPGPLTLVLAASRETHIPALSGGGTVAIRVPANAICLELLRLCGVPLTSTSANRSGAKNPTEIEQVVSAFGEKLDMIINGGPSRSDVPSTILDVTTVPPLVKRVGAIAIEEIRRVVGEVVLG